MTTDSLETRGHASEQSPLLDNDNSTEHPTSVANQRRSSLEAEIAGLQDLPVLKRPSIYWLAPAFLLFAIAWGGIFVPKVDLILTLFCRDYYAEVDPGGFSPLVAGQTLDRCRIPEVHSQTAYFQLITSMISGLLSAITCPRIGAFSDRYGRSKGLSIVAAGMVASEILTAVASSYRTTFPVKLLYLGYVFDGLGGGFNAAMAVSQSYAADCTSVEKRNVSFGYIHGCLYTGVALGPLIAAAVIKLTGNITPFFWIVVACHLAFLISVIAFIPESLSKKRQERTRAAHVEDEPFNEGLLKKFLARLFAFFTPLKVLWPKGPEITPRLRRNLVLLALVDTMIVSIAMGFINVLLYYTRFEFGWNSPTQSLFISVLNILRILCLFLILPLFTKLFYRYAPKRLSKAPVRGCDTLDIWTIRVALLCDTVGFIGYTLVRTSGGFWASGVVGCLAGVGFPTLQSAMSKHVSSDQTGELLGAVGLLAGLAKIITPAALNAIYGLSVGKYTQAVFLFLACACGLLTVATWLIIPGEVSAGQDHASGAAAKNTRSSAANSQIDSVVI